MKRLSFIIMAAFTCFAAIAQKQIINDANAQTRSVSGFHAIRVSNAIDLYLSQDDKEVVAVSASKDEYRDHIKTVVENGVLKIWYDQQGKWWKNNGNHKLKAYVSFKSIDRLDASGASDVRLNGTIKADDFVLNLSGASDFKDGEINANSLTVDLSGASDATVQGKVTNLKIEASGASDFKGYDLVTDNCSAQASGASGINITVNKELNARASGASGINYRGEGKIRDLHTSGASSISRKS